MSGPNSRSRSTRACSALVILIVAVAIFALDFLTKSWVLNAAETAPESLPVVLFHDFFGIDGSITYAENRGAAWGLFADYPYLLVGVRIGFIIALALFTLLSRASLWWKLPVACIIAGALGNVCDTFRYGSVIDMIHLRFWGYDYPVFNVADSAICVGAIWLVLHSLAKKSSPQADAHEQ